jgi:hypothetical protein
VTKPQLLEKLLSDWIDFNNISTVAVYMQLPYNGRFIVVSFEVVA